MKASISLKQLRTNPREYIRLVNSGHEVAITEHRKPLVTTKSVDSPKGNVAEILKIIKSLPKITAIDPELDTVTAVKKSKTEYLEEKYRRIRDS